MITIRKDSSFIVVFFLLLAFSQNISSVSASYYNIPILPYSQGNLYSRIIFTGFSQHLMGNLLVPSAPDGISLLQQYVYSYFMQKYTEKTFFIDHSYEISSSSFYDAFFTQLNASAIPDTRIDYDGTSERYRRIHPRIFNFTGRFISGQETIDWLWNNYNDYFNNPPIPGYTLIISNMTALDDMVYTNHWYNATYIEPDSKTLLTRSYMTGYGSKERLYYMDLSADSYYLQDEGEVRYMTFPLIMGKKG
jgi:hypothetical protein